MEREERKAQGLVKASKESYPGKYAMHNLNHQTLIYTENRAKESLNGRWYFTVDSYDTGLRTGWNRLNTQDAEGRQLPWNYDYDSGEEIVVPSCWNMVKPEYFYYEGSVWYAREFTYRTVETGERVFLRIGAANYDTKIFINEIFLGNHLGGSTPFTVELTEHFKKQNIIQICVNNSRSEKRVPMSNTDWFNYGGLYRDIELYRVKPTFIKNCKIFLVPDDSYRKIQAEIEVDGPAERGEVHLEIPELGISQSSGISAGRAALIMEAKPELWSPEHPKLYEVIVSYQADQIRLRVGFRQIAVQGVKIFLNGQPVFLRGICVHEDDLKLGKTTTESDLRQRFAHAKELGCNFMRLAHYPHHERAAEIADEVGMLLWEEIPVYWAIDFEDAQTYQDAENQLLEMIRRDQNRASVIIWSVGNENIDTDVRLAFMGRLARAAKRADSTRLVSAACLVNEENIKIEDRLADELDVIGLNEYYGWYKPNFEELNQLGENSRPQKPVVITETGADALAGNHGTIHDLFTEEQMAEVYRRQVEFVKQQDYIQGISPWILYDFRAPRRCNRFQRGFNRKGLIAADKFTKKLAFYILQGFYREKQAGQERERS